MGVNNVINSRRVNFLRGGGGENSFTEKNTSQLWCVMRFGTICIT